MVARDFFHDPEVRRWLGNIEPAWTLGLLPVSRTPS
jgi:hypothetical protein